MRILKARADGVIEAEPVSAREALFEPGEYVEVNMKDYRIVYKIYKDAGKPCYICEPLY